MRNFSVITLNSSVISPGKSCKKINIRDSKAVL